MAEIVQEREAEVRDCNGVLKATYHYVRPPRPSLRPLVYISNPTDQLQMFRICKNGKPIAFPLVPAKEVKMVPLKPFMQVHEEDEITVTEHLEEYIYDGTEFD